MRADDIGAALRALRRQKRMSLSDVAARSGNEFRASSLGAYERGDRAISIDRLQRLADIYGVSIERLIVMSNSRPEISPSELVDPLASSGNTRVVLDFANLPDVHGPIGTAIVRFATAIATLRRSPVSLPLTVRSTDAALLASIAGCSPPELEFHLGQPKRQQNAILA